MPDNTKVGRTAIDIMFSHPRKDNELIVDLNLTPGGCLIFDASYEQKRQLEQDLPAFLNSEHPLFSYRRQTLVFSPGRSSKKREDEDNDEIKAEFERSAKAIQSWLESWLLKH